MSLRSRPMLRKLSEPSIAEDESGEGDIAKEEEAAIPDDTHVVKERVLTEDKEPKKRQSKRETAKKKRASNRSRYFTTFVDALNLPSFGTLSHQKRRPRSCEREPTTESNRISSPPSPTEAPTRDLLRQDSDITPGYHGARRFSETLHGCGPGRNSMNSDTDPMALLSQDEIKAKHLSTAENKLKELLSTEQTYVEKNLNEIVEGYYKYIEESKANPEGRIKIPADLLAGKDRIIFGNIRDIYEFHKRSILPELEKCVADPGRLADLFTNKRDLMKMKYGRYCLNKPKSEYIITQHNDKYFAVVRLKQGFQQALSTQMMTPIQRVTRYQLLLSEVLKSYKKAECSEDFVAKVERAFELAQEIAKYTNNMMIAGRIRGFQGDVTSQGLLLKRGTVECFKRKSNLKKPKVKPCHFFVFQETIIICENSQPVHDPTSPQSLDFVASFKMNKVIVREFNKGDSSFGFELERQMERCSKSRESAREDSSIVVQCDTEEQRDEWLKIINDQIRELKDMARKLENPQFYD